MHKLERKELVDLLRQMLLMRRFEEKCAEMYALGKIGGFLHLYIGQEAVATGAISVLRPDDYVIASYREHGHALAKGSDPRKVMAELFGRADGLFRTEFAQLGALLRPQRTRRTPITFPRMRSGVPGSSTIGRIAGFAGTSRT